MTTNNGTAEIYDMEDARARRRAADLPDADFETVGAHLAAVREAAGLTLAEAADKTHIRERHLMAIETLEMESLPSRPYAIGFVRAYAEFLELDAARIVDRFKEEAGYAAPAPAPAEKFEAPEPAAPVESRDMSLLAVIAIIAFFIWCAWQIARIDDIERDAPGASAADASTGSVAGRLPQAPAPAPAEIIEARVIERVDPIYPRGCVAEAAPFETVVIAFNITAGGRVASERVAQSSNPCLNDAALNAVRRWRFEPRTVDGAARPVYDQKYSFSFARPR